MEEIIFEDVADQYIKGEDVIVHFSSSTETKINPDEDQIGLIRVSSRKNFLIRREKFTFVFLFRLARRPSTNV